MKQILVFCVLAFLCGTSAETLDSRGLAVDDSLLLQNVWANDEDKQARGEDNGWVIIPRGALPDLTDCTFPDIEPNPDIDNFNLTGTPYITFDGCGVYVTQNWEGTKIVGSEEQIAEGKTTYKIGRPHLRAVPHCAHPVVEGTKLPFASVAPEDLFEFYFESNCWNANSVLSSFKPYHAGFAYGEVKFNLCPQLATSNVTATNCLQSHDIFATQYGIGIYDSDTDVFSIRRGRAAFDGKPWYAEYKTEFAYTWECPESDDEISFPMGTIVSSFSRINDLSQTMNGTQVICKVV